MFVIIILCIIKNQVKMVSVKLKIFDEKFRNVVANIITM